MPDKLLIEQLINNPNNGKPLPPEIKIEMETRFNVDLSNVKVYTGPEAKAALYRLGANAFAEGNAIIIESETLLKQAAHERAHQIKQRGNFLL